MSAVYFLQEREFIKTGETIYKVGRTQQESLKRFTQYPKGSVLLLHITCDDCVLCEKDILRLFREKYKSCSEIGKEYFEGDKASMMDDIYDCVRNRRCTSAKSVDDQSESVESVESVDDQTESVDDQTESFLTIQCDGSSWRVYGNLSLGVNINTYEQYIRFSQLHSIVLTNKTKYNGYVRFPNQLSRQIVDPSCNKYNEQEHETLKGFITNDSISLYRHKITKEIYSSNELFRSSMEIKFSEYDDLPYDIDIDAIMKDIKLKCYSATPFYYQRPYSSHIISIDNGFKNGHSLYAVFDAVHYNFVLIDDIIEKDTIILSSISGRIIDISRPTDIVLVDSILKSLCPSSSALNSFRRLCYHVFVSPSSTQFIFEDTYKGKFVGELTEWMSDLYYTVTGESVQRIDLRVRDSLKEFKKRKLTKVRLVVIYSAGTDTSKVIDECYKMGIKHFIIIKSNLDWQYDRKAYITYVQTNVDRILSICSMDTRYGDDDINCIFYSTSMLFTSFLKWCLS